MAHEVFHPPQQWTTKECNAFMDKHLRLVPKQRRELEADLEMEIFLKQFKKTPGFQAAFEPYFRFKGRWLIQMVFYLTMR